MSAAARSAAPARAGAAARPASPRTPLAVVPDPRPRHGRSAFVALVAALLALGLGALLGMNTWLAQDAFVVHNLQQERAQLAVTEETLATKVAAEENPTKLATRARALGMRPGGAPLFLELPSGRILGDRRPAADR